ncbi:SdrD B-like domain-containing protein [Lentzea aerocolonigenes]|uniref:SdrD B-like domain-containing protein n=1 Tax=Lentzea aerocolonigenes TaxID=68170 RepID=UPI0004C3013B|nr:SdrD B-like domain-containing protein [Lentzea aerocolonigenes]
MTTAAALVFSTAAFAQDDPTSTTSAPTETSAPVDTSTSPTPAPPAAPLQQQAQDNVTGVLYADKNSNEQQDPGEAISGGKITLFGSPKHETTSDANGRFGFAGIAPGTYNLAYELQDGWVVHRAHNTGDMITVTANATTEIVARAERPYSEQFDVTASLDRTSYEYPGSVKITTTLTNRTGRRIANINSECNRGRAGHALGVSQEWYLQMGLSLEPGQQRTFTVVEKVPQAALTSGVVTLNCDFAPNINWNTDGPTVYAEAKVVGGIGYSMVLGEDKNADQRIDAGEAVSGAKVLLLDPKTGAQIAERTSGADGKADFTGLKAGQYRAVLGGSWEFTDESQQLVAVTEQGGAVTKFLKRATPPSLSGVIKLDKPRYESHEMVRADVTITNKGGKTAERFRLMDGFYDLDLGYPSPWGDVRRDGPGVRIPAGESRTFSVTGKIRGFTGGKLRVWGSVDYVGVPEFGNPTFSAEAEVVQTNGDIGGVVYIDRNHNRQQDPGEEAADVLVEANGGVPYSYFKTTTDANGRYSFKNVPSGNYWVGYTPAGGWVVHSEGDQEIRVVPGTPVQLTARAERPYTEALKATMVLDKSVYSIGEEATITITLSNRAAYEVGHIHAACDRAGNGQLGSVPMAEGWGDLRDKGVTLAAGETKTIIVKEKVPAAARWQNRVVAACDFAPWAAWNLDVVSAYDWASVPGGTGSLAGPLAYDRNKNSVVDPGEAIGNTRIFLMTDREYGAIVAETFSDAEGNVRFDGVPAGDYWSVVDGPWKFEGEWGGHHLITADQLQRTAFLVVPGPAPALPDDAGNGQRDEPTVGGGSTGGGTKVALARTGASVLGLAGLAVLLIALGLGARAAGRRTTT